MITTELQLTEREYSDVEAVAKLLGKSVEQVMHDAVQSFAIRSRIERQKRRLDAAFGMWKDNPGIPDYRKDRDEGSRY
ncbi:MAG: hypothetical protein K1X78_25815 [Verrucomicrobiaceae bacterium]|nr:hypothetical protein [Verrucomicrobiaceae bacterium]